MEGLIPIDDKFKCVLEFHEKFAHPVYNKNFLNLKLLKKRVNLIHEECSELDLSFRLLEQSLDFPSNSTESIKWIAEILDAITDILYVVYGFCVTFNLPVNSMFDRVHQSNMSKQNKDGTVSYNENEKVMKGDNFVPPNFIPLATLLYNTSKRMVDYDEKKVKT